MHPQAAARQLRAHHHLHNTAQTIAAHLTQPSQPHPGVGGQSQPQHLDVAEPPQPHFSVVGPPSTSPRRIHSVPPPTHNSRLGRTPLRATTLADSLAPVPMDDIFAVLTETQSKSNKHVPTRGLMYPGPLAQAHPAGPMLAHFGTHGCPVEISSDWTLEQLDQAVQYGAHPSAESIEATTALRTEALEKVDQGFARLVYWKDLRAQIVSGAKLHTKISPIAAIPHKSRLFRMILDLSNKGQRRRGQTATPSVNELTDPNSAPSQSMDQLGNTLGRVIYAVATQPTSKGPILFCKLDIKDGFWRMCVPKDSTENFCYVLPQLPGQPLSDIQLVVPDSIQMGWTKSPDFFSAGTETGRDIAEWLRKLPSLPPHPLESHTLNHSDPHFYQHHFPSPQSLDDPELCEKFFHLFEVFVDDYIGLVQSTDVSVLQHHSRALLHGIHQIFPPPLATGHDASENPISLKKLVVDGDGIWDTVKEILGWIFNGLERTMQLPASKVQKLRDTIHQTLRDGRIQRKAFESLIGKCQHACLGIPGGRALLPPLYKALAAANKANQHLVHIHPKSAQANALADLQTFIKLLGDNPIHCQQLVPGQPAYIGYCDACKFGAGGIWLSGIQNLHPIVWRIKWPQPIVDRLTDGTLTINDLEMAGILLQYLLLEQLVPMKHLHTAVWCDNTSAVIWTTKMSSSKSLIGQQLTRALAARMITNKSSHLAALSIAGIDNPLADLASRSFRKTGAQGNYDLTDSAFLTKFNSDFVLPQNTSWLLLRLHNNVSSLVFSVLLGMTPPMGSWIRLKKSACDIGLTGPTSPAVFTWTHFSPECQKKIGLNSSCVLPVTSVKGMRVADTESGLAQFRTRFAPSARPLNWTTSPTPPTKKARMDSTGPPSAT